MEVNMENVRRSIQHTLSQLEYYNDSLNKLGVKDTVILNKNFNYEVGQIIYINFNEGFPHELMFGHWSYIVRDSYAKIFVIPLSSVKDKYNEEHNMIIHGWDTVDKKMIESVALLNDARWVDKQRIDVRKNPLYTVTLREWIIKRLKDYLFEGDY